MTDTVQRALTQGRALLVEAGIPTPDLDARWLMAAILGMPPDRVILHLPDPLDDAQAFAFRNALLARVEGRPLSHILGGRWFYGRWFRVTADVLDPRPDTETLVDLALSAPFERVLDLGTGSGCILLSLLAESGTSTGLGVDVSDAALEVASENQIALDLQARAELIQSDWYSAVEGRFDLIVSNPPYISEAAYADLDRGVRDYEPRLALTPGGDGLAPYRVIAADAARFLTPSGRLLVEIGFDQGQAVAAIFAASGLEDVRVHPDINNKDRVVSASAPAAN